MLQKSDISLPLLQVKVLSSKVDYSSVGSKVGSKDKIDHKPKGGDKKVRHMIFLVVIDTDLEFEMVEVLNSSYKKLLKLREKLLASGNLFVYVQKFKKY